MQNTYRCGIDAEIRDLPFTSIADVDRIGLRFCEDPYADHVIEPVQEYRRYRMHCLSTSLGLLERVGLPRRALISVRLKRLDSIYRKITREDTDFRLGRLDDVIGVRVVCDNFQTVLDLGHRIRALEEFYREKDYTHIRHPADTGYRGLHQIIRFQQALNSKSIAVRFEVQIRTYLQHQWAIWSESHGEATKIGRGDPTNARELRVVSKNIEQWESYNSVAVQKSLPELMNVKNIVVAWKSSGASEPFCQLFSVEGNDAFEWLSHLEMEYPLQRSTALLLVGVSDPRNAVDVLRITHPLYTGDRVLAPVYWLPS